MVIPLNVELLRQRLENRFGLEITCCDETVDGGVFPVFRVAGMERGTGFGIVLAKTPKQIEASFLADNFAATLLRRMAESDKGAKGTFFALMDDIKSKRAQVLVGVNGDPCDVLPDSGEGWRRLDLDVSIRLNSRTQQQEEILDHAFVVVAGCLVMALALLVSDDLIMAPSLQEKGLPEGARTRIEVNRYERSPANRAACLNHYGTVCQVCDLDFSEIYGDLGEGYIEVHHRVPVSQMGGDYCLDPIQDLVPLCANCHAMVHRVNPVMQVEELREILEARRRQRNSDSVP